ncbi:MAG TPA: hypothetical protein ENI79_00215, partial [Rhodospirillales bacterium]|nr:hypothetical protein [Rhodospirillales bacterium]
MNPSFLAVIVTASSVAGFGLLAVLGVYSANEFMTSNPFVGLAGVGAAVVLIAIGVVASLLKAGRPERTFSPLDEWRSPWPPRTDFFGKITLVSALVFGFGWGVLGDTDGLWAVAAMLAAILSMASLICTAMIYGCLRPVRQWFEIWTVPGFVTFGIMGGTLLAAPIGLALGETNWLVKYLPTGTIVIAWWFNIIFWDYALGSRNLDKAAVEDPALDFPATGENYLIKDSCFDDARKQTQKWRRKVNVIAFGLPMAFTLISLATLKNHEAFSVLMAVAGGISFLAG